MYTFGREPQNYSNCLFFSLVITNASSFLEIKMNCYSNNKWQDLPPCRQALSGCKKHIYFKYV